MSTTPFSTSSVDEATQSVLSRSRSSSTEGESELGENVGASKEKTSSSPSSSDIETLAGITDDQVSLSKLRKFIILGVFCSAQFFDLFNANAVIVSLPSLGADLNFTPGALQWILSAYTLTFASFMLISGTLSDIYHPKPIFCLGFAFLGLFSIPVAASVHPIMAIVFRALQGIGAAMNVPSAIAMIRITFTDPVERSGAYAAYAIAGTVGNVAGFVIGGVLTARTSWRWVHYLVAILVIPMAIAGWFLLPPHKAPPKSERRSIDIPGVLTLTAGLVLFVYAISDGAEVGWGSPQVITTLVLSVFVVGAFFGIEQYVSNPALPPKTWTNKNFIPLFFYAWSPYWWCLSCELQLVSVFMVRTLFCSHLSLSSHYISHPKSHLHFITRSCTPQNLWGDSALIAAVRCIPMGVAGGIASYLSGRFVPRLPPNYILVGSQVLMAVGSVLFALADTRDKYWPYVFPGMIVGMLGLAAGYVACTAVVMGGARKGEEGVVGAVMYTAYQVGSTLGFAIVTSITEGVNSGRADDPISRFEGYAASFWSMVALPGVMIVIALFVRP
ncbi:hypothetical protein CCMSSC00406_0009478 [Pleurotus cornucopiae]|uniref:Uncharacterized protein n=1 Tax=Pleurotus cornucopiae TaxID=5321 RepID=A0ACB7J5D7_PLECO|nr:hypothetical protein CCMSSC00406_0009478 [Pleurotus cornucopiae]